MVWGHPVSSERSPYDKEFDLSSCWRPSLQLSTRVGRHRTLAGRRLDHHKIRVNAKPTLRTKEALTGIRETKEM